jgi:hypothetical protein
VISLLCASILIAAFLLQRKIPAHLGPMCPPFILNANRNSIFRTSFGSVTAPGPSRMFARVACNLRMRAATDTIVAIVGDDLVSLGLGLWNYCLKWRGCELRSRA